MNPFSNLFHHIGYMSRDNNRRCWVQVFLKEVTGICISCSVGIILVQQASILFVVLLEDYKDFSYCRNNLDQQGFLMIYLSYRSINDIVLYT